jgi:hypothetical protein
MLWRREISCPCRDSISDPSVVQPVARRYTEWANSGMTALLKSGAGFSVAGYLIASLNYRSSNFQSDDRGHNWARESSRGWTFSHVTALVQGPARSPIKRISIQTLFFLSIYLSIVLLLHLGRFSVSWSFTQSLGLLGRGISLSQGRYLHTGQHKHRINAHTHPCLKWDSNPRSQCLSRRRQAPFLLGRYKFLPRKRFQNCFQLLHK